MKKNIIFLVIALAAFMFVGVQSADAQAHYSVTFGWNDFACECGEILDKEVKITLYTYPGNVEIDPTDWETATTNPYTVYSTVDELEDCQTDCYKVVAEVRYTDSSGLCCSGSAYETFTGSELSNGATFTLTIPMY